MNDSHECVPPERWVGVTEIADVFGVGKTTITNWHRFYADFPEPLKRFSRTPIWDLQVVIDWWETWRETGHRERKGGELNPVELAKYGIELDKEEAGNA